MREYRRDFPDFGSTVYLDCAYQGPFPRATVARIQQAIELKCRPDRLGSAEYFDLPERVRNSLSRLVGADPEEIALTNSATQGLGVVGAGLELGAGDNVVIASSNFPANLFTWLHLRRRGVQVNLIKPVCGRVRIEDVRSALTARTRVLALDWVSYSSGLAIDLAAMGELAHRQGSLFVVDGTQGVGAIELNVRDLPVDAVAAAAYKWLLGPYGTGFVYLHPDLRDRLDLNVVNWLSVEGSEDFDALPMEQFILPKSARIFDVPGTASFLNLYALEASLQYVEKAGVGTVHAYCTGLLEHLAQGLARLAYTVVLGGEGEPRSTILGFQAKSPEETERIHRKLRANEVAVSLRHGIIRVSPYLYNSEAEIERLLEVVRS